MKKIIIAVDGHSSCGKSTLAKALASELDYIYIDSGAMYRACTLFFLQKGWDYSNPEIVEKAIPQIKIHFEKSQGENLTFLNGKEVEQDIRSMEVSNLVSQVAAISEIRRAMVAQQQAMGKHKGIVMDGRDIGTVVFPEAELKIFLTASIEERSRRRFLELQAKGKNISFEEVQANLVMRDHIDSNREDSPLLQAEDAVVIDNTHFTPAQQLELALQFALKRMERITEY